MLRAISLRSAALMISMTCWLALGASAAQAQQGDDLRSLDQQFEQLYRGGKYAEAIEIAKRALALAERQLRRPPQNLFSTVSVTTRRTRGEQISSAIPS